MEEFNNKRIWLQMNLGDLEDKAEKNLPELNHQIMETMRQCKRQESSIQNRPK